MKLMWPPRKPAKAAERDALNALIDSLRKDGADASAQITAQEQVINSLNEQITQSETERLLSAAVAEELRKRLKTQTLN